MLNRNYQKELDCIIEDLTESGTRPSLLIHSCCAPCSSYVLEYLSKHFDISVYYYNPNISPESEYTHRYEELKRLLLLMGSEGSPDGGQPVRIGLVDSAYEPDKFNERITGLEDEPEGGLRCAECFRLRMEATAKAACDNGFDFYATTLSVSPHKDARLLNEIGEELGEKYRVGYLVSDFKKKDGYKRSIELSKLYGLFRQNYCGCKYSKSNGKNEEK